MLFIRMSLAPKAGLTHSSFAAWMKDSAWLDGNVYVRIRKRPTQNRDGLGTWATVHYWPGILLPPNFPSSGAPILITSRAIEGPQTASPSCNMGRSPAFLQLSKG